MRTIGAVILATTLLASSAFAADSAAPATPAQTGPLAAGKPAGVHQADIETGGVLLWGGIALAAGAIAIIASNTQGNSTNSTASTQ